MEAFARRNGELYAEEVAVSRIAREVGTPCYVYSKAALLGAFDAYTEGFAALGQLAHLVCYSVKANSNLAVLAQLAHRGSGFDVVSGGELARVLAAGGQAAKVVFSGVGKQDWEIREALQAGILMINVECPAELDLIDRVAQATGIKAPVALRVNPDVDAKTPPYISTGLRTSKFGIAMERCMEDYQRAASMDGLDVVGLDCHIGSQLLSAAPVAEAAARAVVLVDRLAEAGIELSYLDMGGGLGIVYDNEAPPAVADWAGVLGDAVGKRKLTIIVEPGRSIAGNAGILLTKALFHKSNAEKNFLVVDAAMNDLARPSLYDAYHRIEAVMDTTATVLADVVGPVCESGDFLARDREVPAVEPGGLLAVMSAGAYGFVMASNYNSRPRPAEVMVDGSRFHVVRRRESTEDLYSTESIAEELVS